MFANSTWCLHPDRFLLRGFPVSVSSLQPRNVCSDRIMLAQYTGSSPISIKFPYNKLTISYYYQLILKSLYPFGNDEHLIYGDCSLKFCILLFFNLKIFEWKIIFSCFCKKEWDNRLVWQEKTRWYYIRREFLNSNVKHQTPRLKQTRLRESV